MDPATAMAIVATVDILIKYGAKVVKMCQAYARAEQALKELVVRLENHWTKVNKQMEFLKEWADHMPRDLLAIQAKTLAILTAKLNEAELTVLDLFPAERPQTPKIEPQPAEAKLQLPVQNVLPSAEEPKQGTLSTVTAVFDHMIPKRMEKRKKAKYAFLENKLKGLVDSIRDWQGEFDPTWWYVLSLQKKSLEEHKDDTHGVVVKARAFQSSLFATRSSSTLLTNRSDATRAVESVGTPDTTEGSFEQESLLVNKDFILSERRRILFSSVLGTFGKDKKIPLLLDYMMYDPAANPDEIATDALTLAHRLAHIDPLTFGLLQCCGLIRSDTSDPSTALSFSFLFSIPDSLHSPKSLRSTLANQTPCSLSERFNLAKRLANAVSFVHTSNFVHKNIRPETIMLLSDDQSTLGLAFLVGFSKFRHAKGPSLLQGDDLPAKNLYRHPSRQGTHPESYYKMQHDIYSLGVCLLEIGLWKSFIIYTDSDADDAAALSRYLDIPESIWDIRDNRERANEVKACLMKMAETKLVDVVGGEYAGIVVSCLGCLDSDWGMVGERAGEEDDTGLLIGVRFIQEVVLGVHRLHV